MKLSFLLASGLILTTPAFAQTSGGVMSGSGAILDSGPDTLPEGSEDSESDDGERRICRRVETDSASRMATRRLCLTARQWREHQRRIN